MKPGPSDVVAPDPLTPAGMVAQGERGEDDVPVHGDRGTQQVEQFDGGDPAGEQRPARVAVLGDDPQGTVGRGRVDADTGLFDEVADPAFGATAGEQAPPVPWADERRALDHGVQVDGAAVDLRRGQRHPGPGADHPGQQPAQLVVERHRAGRLPGGNPCPPLGVEEVPEPPDRRRRHDRHEHGLAVGVRRAVQPLHAAPAGERPLYPQRHGALALEALVVVEQRGGGPTP